MKYTFYRPLGYNIEHVYKLSTVVGGESRDTSLTDADKYLGILAKVGTRAFRRGSCPLLLEPADEWH